MIPLRDYHKPKTTPIVNYLIILVNVLVFLFQLAVPNFEVFVRSYGFVSAEFSYLNIPSYFPAFTSMWLHGGWFHLISNMWFLHIFGDNVEDRMGKVPYILFYFGAGFASVLLQYVINPSSPLPLIGASGAISGVSGAYYIWYKRSSIEALIPSFVGLWHRVRLPVWFFLGYWFVIQIFSGVGSIASTQAGEGGVAFFAHIGGFLFGLAVAKILYKPVRKRSPLEVFFEKG